MAYEPQLIDATYALLISSPGDALVIPALNRDGDCLSNLVMQLFGSIAGAESVLLAFDEQLRPSTVMAEAPHGTAPRLFGKNVANPMAMILAEAALLGHIDDPRAAERIAGDLRSRPWKPSAEAPPPAISAATRSTSEFTDAVIDRVKTKLDVWASL